MAIAGYLLGANETQVKAFNTAVMSEIGLHFGLALTLTSSTRAYVSAALLKRVRSALGESRFQKLLKSTKIRMLAAVDAGTAKSLVETRDAEDLADRPNLEQPPRHDTVTGGMLDWHLVEAGVPGAWAVLGGPRNIQWGDVAAGHIDTGFTAHPVLGFKAGGVSEWVDTGRDRNFFGRELLPPEGEVAFATYDSAHDTLGGFSGGHGTRTMSVLCGYSESAAARKSGVYSGYFGVAPRLPVVPVRVEDTIWIEAALNAWLPDAIDYLVDIGVGVISLSMGTPGFGHGTVPRPLRSAIDNAYARGVIFCCAAGNHVPDERVVLPARCPRTLAVGGSAPGYTRWHGSSYGTQVDISAPAFPVRRATTTRGGKFEYGVGDGTSYATPHVAGTAAMWLAHRRGEIAARYPEPWQRVAAFVDLVSATAHPGQGDWNVRENGPGVINAAGVLNAPLPHPDSLRPDRGQY